MKELIQIQITEGKETVNARELHEFLESKQEFTNWFRNRINEFGFEKGNDFIVIDKFITNLNGGRPLDGYFVSLDMAKELSMVERNKKGKQARRYFIECENKLKNLDTSKNLSMRDLNSALVQSRNMAKFFGQKGNQALLTANKTVKKMHGVDCMELIECQHLINDEKDLLLTPTDIGKLHGHSPQKINLALEAQGFQKRIHYGEYKKWEPTDKGKPYCEVLDTGKAHSDGTPVQQIKWYKKVCDFIFMRNSE